jgi:hypothetical protein
VIYPAIINQETGEVSLTDPESKQTVTLCVLDTLQLALVDCGVEALAEGRKRHRDKAHPPLVYSYHVGGTEDELKKLWMHSLQKMNDI